ncbi:hypothetical protein M430DRAFT_164539 [Amorphotheca resinae ATCC 22711]|uniref:Uncharacterized protein n=1 Tax=Amorphotheca resinae ATCC 22711 TaxID=857342 RepID=A0A2T3BFS5_AMORE|nr:hypothetical protein M430DRAFT_164539 [Amorphotheca resinae ATCC 22711]PSS28224.1 hypothetical protein M430DRAFT_164539 [Amorphotheca resinae ATCC 22711]
MNLEGVTKGSMKRSRCEVREKGRNEEYAAASFIQRANGLPIYKCRNGQFSHHPLRSSNNGSVSPAPASRWRKKDGRRGKKRERKSGARGTRPRPWGRSCIAVHQPRNIQHRQTDKTRHLATCLPGLTIDQRRMQRNKNK